MGVSEAVSWLSNVCHFQGKPKGLGGSWWVKGNQEKLEAVVRL